MKKTAIRARAAYAFDPSQCDVGEEIRRLTDGLGHAVINTIPFKVAAGN